MSTRSATASKRRTLAWLLALVAAVVVAAMISIGPDDTSAAEVRATPATLAEVFEDAGAGDTILLAAGDYGTVKGSKKAGEVTLRPAPEAKVKIALNLTSASNITVDGVNLTYAVIGGGDTKNITVRNSDVTGLVVLKTSELQNANILLEHNDHHDWDACADCYEGRIQLAGYTSGPSGVTIQHSEFRGGLSDGIQDSSHGTRILANTFHDIPLAEEGGRHVDAIQLLGTSGTVIRGNFFARVPTAIMAPDGVDHAIIEDNVFAGTTDGYPYAISLGSDNGTIIRHNTLADGDCGFNLRCGIVSLGSKEGNPAGRGTVIKDNIANSVGMTGGRATVGEQRGNLFRQRGSPGNSDTQGVPEYVGGSHPTTYAGFALAAGSPGKGSASDGLDSGARIGDGPPTGTIAATSGSADDAKLQVSRLRIDPRGRRIHAAVPISRRASGTVFVMVRGAGRTYRFDARIDSRHGAVRFSHRLPRDQARLGSAVMTLKYAGDADTRAHAVRLRAASRSAHLAADRPRLADGRLSARGTIAKRAGGTVRVELRFSRSGKSVTKGYSANIRNGRWRLDEEVPQSVREAIANRDGTVQSYVRYVGDFGARISGEMRSYRILGKP